MNNELLTDAKKRQEENDRRMKELGETPFTTFDEILVTSWDNLFDTQSKQGVIPGWLFNYWCDRESRPALNFDRMGYIASIMMGGLPMIGLEVLEDSKAGNAEVIIRVCGNSEDEPYYHELYRAAREVGLALSEYLKRRYLAGRDSAANAPQVIHVNETFVDVRKLHIDTLELVRQAQVSDIPLQALPEATNKQQDLIPLPDPAKMKAIWEKYVMQPKSWTV